AADPTPASIEFFEKQVRPVLAEQCYSCHGEKKQSSGLRLDSKAAILKGTDDGPVIVAGQPDKSKLITAIRHAGELKMPPKTKLQEQSIAALTEWVRIGAPYPENSKTAATNSAQSHWAY